MRIILGYVAAVLAAYLIGCIAISQGNIAAVVGMGFEVTFSQRLESAQHDVLSMTALYLPIISVSFLIALPAAALVIKRYPNLRRLGFVLGGFVALVAIHLIIKQVFGISGIAPTRTIMGLVMQGVGALLAAIATTDSQRQSWPAQSSRPGCLSRGLAQFADRVDDSIDDTVLDGLINAHPIIPVGILFNLLKCPTGFVRDDLIDPFFGLQDLFHLNFDVGCVAP